MKKIPVVNGLRGFAICSVVFHHLFFGAFLYGKQETTLLMQTFQSVLSSGWLGVNLFFILSGLVLYWPYARGDRAFSQRGEIRDFYKRRFIRLLPLYWFICVVSLVFATDIPVSDPSFHRWFAALATVVFPFSVGSFVPRPNWVLWSLGVEIIFSVVFPGVVLVLQRFGWRKVMVGGLVLSFAARLVGQIFFCGAPNGYLLNAVSDSLLGRFDEFLLGMLLAHLIATPSNCGVFSGARTVAGGLAVLFAMCAWGAWLRLEIPGWSGALISWPLNAGLFFIIGRLVSAPGPSRLRQLFELWPLQMLGLMCYSIYLWHGIVMVRLSVAGKGIAEHFTYLVIVIILSWFTYRYIEFGRERDIRKLMPQRRDALSSCDQPDRVMPGA